MMLQDLRISPKLLKIFILGIPTNPTLLNQQYTKVGGIKARLASTRVCLLKLIEINISRSP